MSFEIVFNLDGFGGEIGALAIAGESISAENILEHRMEELPTCGNYVSQDGDLSKLLTLYQGLLQKDVSDLFEMKKVLHGMDADLSDVFSN